MYKIKRFTYCEITGKKYCQTGVRLVFYLSDSFKSEFRAAVSCSKPKNYIISRICFWVKQHFRVA